MQKFRMIVAALVVAILSIVSLPEPSLAKDKFTLAVSIYAG